MSTIANYSHLHPTMGSSTTITAAPETRSAVVQVVVKTPAGPKMASDLLTAAELRQLGAEAVAIADELDALGPAPAQPAPKPDPVPAGMDPAEWARRSTLLPDVGTSEGRAKRGLIP